MKVTIEYNSRKIEVNISNPIDISIPIDTSKKNVNAWYIDDPKIAAEEQDAHCTDHRRYHRRPRFTPRSQQRHAAAGDGCLHRTVVLRHR